MAEAPKDRFRRLIKELSEDDRTFLDTNLLGVYRRGIDYGKAQGFFSDNEANTYRNVASQRLEAIRKVPVLDQSGQPITKTIDVPVIRDGKQVTIKRTTPLTPFDLQKKYGGQMEGGDVNGPIYTSRGLSADSTLQDVISQRVKLKEQIAPAIQARAKEDEQKRGVSALNKPGTVMGLLAGGLAAPFVGASKDYQAAVMRGAGVSPDEIARRVYGFKSPEIDKPFELGVEHAGIFGQTLEESVLPSLIGTGTGIVTGGAAATLAAPTAPFTAGLGPAAAALAVGMPTAYYATELAQKGQQAVKKAILGDDVYAARQRQMQEATSANPYGAIGGQMAANFAVATPTLPSLSLLKGGLAAGKAGANAARVERAMINAGIPPKAFLPQTPATGLGGVVSNSKFYNLASGAMEGAITSKLSQKLSLDTMRGAVRGFTGSEAGREFISDIAERGIEGMTDFQQAMAQREKDKLAGRPETPLYQIMAQTLFGSLFEGRGPASKAFDVAGRVGQNLGTTALRAMGDTTSSDFVPLGRMAPLPTRNKTVPTPTTPAIAGATAPTATTAVPERLELPEGIIPIGKGRVAEVNREGFTSNVKSVLDLPADYLDIRMNKAPGQVDMSENVYNAVSRLAPEAGAFQRIKEAFTGPASLKAEKTGDSFEQLAGFTDDGFAKVNIIKPNGDSTYNLVSLDMLSPVNRKKAEKVMSDSGITPASITGYTKSDVQLDIAKNFELRSASDPSLKDNFKNQFWMGDTLVPGRIVSKVDSQHVVMQLPSATSGVDMIVVPNVNVEKMGQPQEILDTRTITPYNPSEYSVDKNVYSPLRKDVDRVSTKDLAHPMMLTPEQASRASSARQLIIDKKRELVTAGEDAKSINQKADASIKAATNEMLAQTRVPAEFAFDEGTLVEFTDASGQLRMGVVVDNSPFGPVLIDVDAPTKPAFVVQESVINRTSVPMRKIPKAKAEAPKTTKEAVARRTGKGKGKGKGKAKETTPVVPDVVAEATKEATATTTAEVKPATPTAPTTTATGVVTAPTTLEPGKVLPSIKSNADVEAVLNAKPSIDGLDVTFKGINYETRYASGRNQPIVDYTGQTPILDYNGRKLIVVDINGVRVPFYCSSGAGGKVDVPAGKWYPFFGISNGGWINKTSGPDITSYYGSDALAKVADYLDSNLGDIRAISDIVKVGSVFKKQLAKHIREINDGLSPAENERPDTDVKVRENINKTIDRLNKALGTTTPAVTPTITPTVTPAGTTVGTTAPQVTPTAATTPVDSDTDVLTAARILFGSKEPKISDVQNQMKIGYTKAKRLLDRLVNSGIVKIVPVDKFGGRKIETIVSKKDMESMLAGKPSAAPTGTTAPQVTPTAVATPQVTPSVTPQADTVTAPEVTPAPYELPNTVTSRLRKIKTSLELAVNAEQGTRLPRIYAERNPTPENIATLNRKIGGFNATANQYLYEVNKVLGLLSDIKTDAVKSLKDAIDSSDAQGIANSKVIIQAVDDAVSSLEKDYLSGNKRSIWTKFPDVVSRFESTGKAFDAINAIAIPEVPPTVSVQPGTREVTPQDIIAEGSSFTPTAEVVLTPTQQVMVDEGDDTAFDEGSYLDNVQPGDVTVAEGDSLVRVRASIEGVGEINEVLAKARNREELEVVIKDSLIRSGQIKDDTDATTAARAVAAYYDEMIHAFVNRDLYVAQLIMQDIESITPVERKTIGESAQPLMPSPVDPALSFAAKKVAWRRNRTASLIQAYDMPRINSIIEAINKEASSRQTVLNEMTGEYVAVQGLTFADVESKDTRRTIMDNVRTQLVRQRYKTNIPVFKVIDAGPRLDSAYDKIFEKRGGYTTIYDERTNAGQQVVFLMANNSDIGTTVHELSHAILDNMPVHMASELATRFGKTLRVPTTLNESYIPYELHEMFATAMEQSFLSGKPPAATRGNASGSKRLNEIWGKISKFMQVAYSETYGFKDSSGHVNWAANRLEWSVPYDNNNVFLWDGVPVTVKLGDKLVRATVLKTDKFPDGPGLVADDMVNQPIVSVKFHDPVSGLIKTEAIDDKNAFGKADIKPSDIISIGGITQGMSPNLGSMIVKWVSGYSSQRDTYGQKVSIIGLRNTYEKTNEQIISDNPQGLLDKIDTSDKSILKLIDKAVGLDKGGIDRTSSEWKGYLFGIGNRSMGAINRALNYGLVTTLPTPTSHTNLNSWVDVIGSLRKGQFLKEFDYTDASGNTVKKNALDWVQSGWRDLATDIKALEPFHGALELQARERKSAAQRRSGNSGGNVLHQSRRRSSDATLRKEAAQRIAGNSNPHSITPEASAYYATYDGVPRDIAVQFIDTRVGADALRTFDGTADIRTLEIDDVLVIDGTIDASADTLDSMKKTIDFAQRNGIDNVLLHTQAGKTEPLGYSNNGYSVEPSVTFTSPEVITDDIYTSVRREYPAIRISPDRKSVTMVHLEDRGKTYEESLEDFSKAIEQVANKLIEADVPVQGIQSTERVWNFGNESGRGYAINYDEARNVLNITAPHLFGVDDKPKVDLTIRPTIEGALSLVRGKTVSLPAKFDMDIASDSLERLVEFGNQHDKLPDVYYQTTDSKRVYSALTKELPRQFKFLDLSVSFTGSASPSKVTVTRDTRVDERNPMLADSGLTTVDGQPLKFSEVADAIYSSIRSGVQVVSGGEHSDNLAFAAHASLTQDPWAIWGLWSETTGRRANTQFSGNDIRKTALPPLDTLKTGVVGIDKRIDAIYKDANNEFGHLNIKDSNNAISPATLASGRGVTLFSSRKRDAQSWADYGGPKSRDFNTHQSPDTAIDSLFVKSGKDWAFSPDVVDQLSNRNSALLQMFNGNRDHAVQYLKEAVLANVSMTGNRTAGIRALDELGVREDFTDTTFDSNESYVKKRMKALKSFINPVDGKVKLYHASNNVIDINNGGLVTANTLSRINGNMDATLAGLSMLEPQTSNLGGTPSVTSMTYDIRYALDIARVANNFRNVLLDSRNLLEWRNAAKDRVRTAILSYKAGDSYVSDRVRKMSGIDNANVPDAYKSMVRDIAGDSHALDMLALTSGRLKSSNDFVRNGYENAFTEIDILMPILSKADPKVASAIQETIDWMKANQKPVKDARDIDGVNPIYLVAYADWKAKSRSAEDVDDAYDFTIAMLDGSKPERRKAIDTLGQIENNHESIGLPSAYMTDFSLKAVADMTPDELSKRSIGILEYEADPSLLVEHNPDEVEIRTYAPSSLGTPSTVYTPDGNVVTEPTTKTYRTLWSARPIKPPVRVQTVVDEDGTVTEVREETPTEASEKVKEALKISEWVMKPYGVVNDLARNSVGGDWSSILIQNWMTANPIENPKLFLQQFLIGLKMMKPNLGFQKKDGSIINQNMMLGRQEFHELGDQLRGTPFYNLAKEAGLILNTARVDERLEELRKTDPRATLMDVDELGMDKDLAPTHAILKHGPLQGASERTMSMTKDYVKMMKFNQSVQHYIEIGYNPRSSKFIEVAKDLAGLLNVAQGDIKFVEDKDMDDLIGRNLRNLMFAPRWLSSRFMFDPLLRGAYTFVSPNKGTRLLEINRMYKKYGEIDPYVRAENNRLYMKSAAMFSFLGLLLSRFNPFGELAVETEVTGMGTVIRVGDYTFKAPGGALYHMEIMNTLIKGIDTREGETTEERLAKTSDQLKMLIMSKAAPAVSLVSDMVSGRNIIGEPSREAYKPLKTYWEQVTRPALQTVGLDMPAPQISNLVADRFFYLWAQDALDTYDAVYSRGGQYPGVEAGAVAALAFIGGRVRYAPKELKWQYRANDNDNPVPGWEYTFSGVDGDAFFEEQARNVQ